MHRQINNYAESPLVSVIVPVYGVERFIERCLLSIINQTYANLEIIFVDDATPDNSVEIIQRYAEKDSRIHILTHETNKGLFLARMTGMKKAKGDYIAFVDSDDHISCDWFRVLVSKIVEQNAEMVLGNTINEDEAGRKTYYNNYRSLTKSNVTIYGKDIITKLLEQEGSCFAWHTVWNKLYAKSLINKSMPYLDRIDRHLIMGEDIAYASVFYSMANSLAFANIDAYFYYRHSDASTSLSLPKPKIKKNLEDIGFVFKYAEDCICDINKEVYTSLEHYFTLFKDRYFRIWSSNLIATGYSSDKTMVDTLCKAFNKEKLKPTLPHEFYFYEMSTRWDDSFEKVKKAITSKEVNYVSFDIFDTLIKRPVYKPTDIFYLMAQNPKISSFFSNDKAFCDMRVLAEQHARKKIAISKSFFEDITLSEIYLSFCELFGISDELANEIKECEEQIEIAFSQPRESIKELYDLAIYTEKTILIASDMYLSQTIIENILEKNGYDKYKKLYLSSECKRLKATGSLYTYILKDQDIKEPSTILHIGDNWNSDIVMAQNNGMKAFFFPKCTDVFERKISDIHVGELSSVYTKNLDSITDNVKLMEILPIRLMLSVVANKLFDNPFQSYQIESDYNCDSYLTGYYTLGMHLFGLVNWIHSISKKEQYGTIHFLARDGYLTKEIFDMVAVAKKEKINTNYFYATRKSLLPYLIERKEDFYNIYQYIDISKHTPQSILEIYSPILKPLSEDFKEKYIQKGVLLDKRIQGQNAFVEFINTLLEISFDQEYLKNKNKVMYAAFDNVFGINDVVFDIGYSGRLQNILCKLAGKTVDAFYIHHDGTNALQTAKNSGFKIHSFYEYTPKISGIIREFFISEPAPSCIGYNINGLKLEPIFENAKFPYQESYAIRKYQQGAYDFCLDISTIFQGYLDIFEDMRPMDASAAFEYYLLNAKQCDQYVFSASNVEDNVYSGYSSKRLFDIWMWHLSRISRNSTNEARNTYKEESSDVFGHQKYPFLDGRSKLFKASFYLLYDRKVFLEKFKFWRKVRRNIA